MTIGGIVGILALAGAFVAAAVRRRDAFWAAMAMILVILVALTIARSGLDATFITDADDVAILIGSFLMAAMVTLGLGFRSRWRIACSSATDCQSGPSIRPSSGRVSHSWPPPRPATSPRLAWRTGDTRSRSRLRTATGPPWLTGSRKAMSSGRTASELGVAAEEWLPWQTRTAQLSADWDALRGPVADRRRNRAAIVRGTFRVGTIAAAVCFVIGFAGVPTGLASRAPEGRATIVPVHPPGRSVYLAPPGGISAAELQDLADFYAVRYDLDVGILPPAPVPAGLQHRRQPGGCQYIIGLLPSIYPEATDPSNVVIGVLPGDVYVHAFPSGGGRSATAPTAISPWSRQRACTQRASSGPASRRPDSARW